MLAGSEVRLLSRVLGHPTLMCTSRGKIGAPRSLVGEEPFGERPNPHLSLVLPSTHVDGLGAEVTGATFAVTPLETTKCIQRHSTRSSRCRVQDETDGRRKAVLQTVA